MAKLSLSRHLFLALSAGMLLGGLGIAQASAATAYSVAQAAAQACSEAAANAALPVPKVVIDSSCTKITAGTVHASEDYLADKNPDANFGTTFDVMCQVIVPVADEPVQPTVQVTELASR